MRRSTHMTRPITLVAWLTLVLCSLAASSHAQGVQTGTLRGAVTDPQGQSVPGATVTISSPALQGQRTTTSDTEGVYVFRALPPGSYTVNFSLTGFATVDRRTDVPLGGVAVLDAKMTLANVTEQVSVLGAVPAPIATPVVGLNIKHEESRRSPRPGRCRASAHCRRASTRTRPTRDSS